MSALTPIAFLKFEGANIKSLLDRNAITSAEFCRHVLGWIEQHNRQSLVLRSMIAVAPRNQVLARTEELDHEGQRGRTPGSLHRVPIVVKACFQAPNEGLFHLSPCDEGFARLVFKSWIRG